MASYRRRRWREAMAVRIDLNGLAAVAEGTDAPPACELESVLAALEEPCARLRTRRLEGALPSLALPHRGTGLRAMLELAAAVQAEFETLVVLGTGIEARAAQAFVSALAPESGGGPRVVVADSADPGAMQALLGSLDLARTVFDVVSQRGDSAETMAQFLIVRDRLLRELGGLDYKRHVIVTTDATAGALRQIVNDEGFRDLAIPAPADGAPTALSAVGFFPALVAGVDVEEALAGAAFVEERGRVAESPIGDPALVLAAALWCCVVRHGLGGIDVRAYCERLGATRDWFLAVWGRVGPAPTVGPAHPGGTTLFLRVEDHGTSVDVPAAYQDIEEVGYLGGHSLGALVNAEQRMAEMLLGREGRPSVTVTLPAVNAFTVGQLVCLLETAAVAAGALAGDGEGRPPRVEAAARGLLAGMLGRVEGESGRREAEAWLARKSPRLIV
ncbi:MAG: hypothetical protein U0807_03935 [Candidatus Binatia bacterium]